jgi:hypothetical protein
LPLGRVTLIDRRKQSKSCGRGRLLAAKARAHAKRRRMSPDGPLEPFHFVMAGPLVIMRDGKG